MVLRMEFLSQDQFNIECDFGCFREVLLGCFVCGCRCRVGYRVFFFLGLWLIIKMIRICQRMFFSLLGILEFEVKMVSGVMVISFFRVDFSGYLYFLFSVSWLLRECYYQSYLIEGKLRFRRVRQFILIFRLLVDLSLKRQCFFYYINEQNGLGGGRGIEGMYVYLRGWFQLRYLRRYYIKSEVQGKRSILFF